MRWLFSILLCIGSIASHGSSPTFTYTSGCQQAYRHIMRLELPLAEQLLAQEKAKHPNNLIPIYLENYIDFFRLYMHEDEAWYYEILDRKKDRLRQLQEGDKTSPFYLFCQAEVRIQWAVARLKFEEYMGAFTDVRKAYKLLQANLFIHPDFLLSKKSMGVLKAVIGAIPDKYQWGAALLGMQGTITQGTEYLRQLQQSQSPLVQLYRPEVDMLLAYLTLHLEQDEAMAWQQVNRADYAANNDLLGHFVKASIALEVGNNDAAIQTLEMAPRDENHEPFPFIDFLLGTAKSRQLDPTAVGHFQAFLDYFPGRHYKKEAYQKMAWMALIGGDTTQYKAYMQQLQQTGTATVDPDKAAQEEAERGEVPHPLLLKARLRYDGGYYEEALTLLKDKKRTDFDRLRDQLEFTYRAGRILQAQHKYDLAKKLFYATLKYNDGSAYYFAPNAALQLGLIFEEEGNKEKARYFFEKCRSYKGHAYESSLDTQAKAGLQRLDN
mgnify:CR=1 FL=1